MTGRQTPLQVGDVALEVDQSLVVLLHVRLQAVTVVIVLTRPTVPHNHVENGLTLMFTTSFETGQFSRSFVIFMQVIQLSVCFF